MRINLPELVTDQQNVKLRSLIECGGQKEYVWYSVDRQYGDFLTVEKLDSFLVSLLMIAMERGEDIYIEGAISEKLYYNLTNYYIEILSLTLPSLQKIRIIPKELDDGTSYQAQGNVVTGFSGGIDSFCVLADHLYDRATKNYQVTHLLYNNVGSHGQGGRQLFEERYTRLLKFAESAQLHFIKLDSNVHEVFKMDFRQICPLRNAAASLALQKLFSKYLYASAYRYEDCFAGRPNSMGLLDPVSVHLLSTETLECISTGCQHSRVEKTMRVAELELSYKYLDVCVNDAILDNCSFCWKCNRTLLTLDILGKLDLYDKVFNLKQYSKVKPEYIAKVLRSKDFHEIEIRELMEERNYQIPWQARVELVFPYSSLRRNVYRLAKRVSNLNILRPRMKRKKVSA